MENIDSRPVVVSVCIVSYCQVDFIGQCLESILTQETDFRFEVIVGDDGSTDGTREIIQKFSQQYPGKLIPLFHEKNIGATKNYLSVHGKAQGKYIAHCDGDDYWLQGKLAHQVALLEADEGLAVVGETAHDIPEGSLLDINDLLKMANPMIHSSKMYRRENILTRASQVDLLDFYFNVEHARSGKVALERSRYTVYRRNVGVLQRMGMRFYDLNCEAAYRAFQLGADRAAAHAAARAARISLVKQSIHDSNWPQLDKLLKPGALEAELSPSSQRTLIEKVAQFRLLRPFMALALRTKRICLSS